MSTCVNTPCIFWYMARVVHCKSGKKFYPFLHPTPDNVILKILALRSGVCFPSLNLGWPHDLLWPVDTSKCESAYALGLLCSERWGHIVNEPRLSCWGLRASCRRTEALADSLLTTRRVSEIDVDHLVTSQSPRHLGESRRNLLSDESERPKWFAQLWTK